MFTESSLRAELDPDGTGHIINIVRFIPGSGITTIYALGVIAPYAGRAKWVSLDETLTPTEASDALKAALLE